MWTQQRHQHGRPSRNEITTMTRSLPFQLPAAIDIISSEIFHKCASSYMFFQVSLRFRSIE
jgi:hypothetical protein